MNTEPKINRDTRLIRDNGIVFSETDGETLMMSLEKGEYYGVNPIGSRIWALLEAPKKAAELCDALQPDYDVTPEQCVKDILAFLDQMAEKGIVKILPE